MKPRHKGTNRQRAAAVIREHVDSDAMADAITQGLVDEGLLAQNVNIISTPMTQDPPHLPPGFGPGLGGAMQAAVRQERERGITQRWRT